MSAQASCVWAEYGSIKSWQLKRKEGCEMVGGLHSSNSPQFSLQHIKSLAKKLAKKGRKKTTLKLIISALLAGQVICCNDAGCNDNATVISNFICSLLAQFLLFCPNSSSGLSYSLNTGSLKAENSLN